MRKHNNGLQSVHEFSSRMSALGEAAGFPSEKTLEKRARSERRRQIGLAVADLVLQPLVEIQQAHAEQSARAEIIEFKNRMTDDEIRLFTEQGEGVIVYPFRG